MHTEALHCACSSAARPLARLLAGPRAPTALAPLPGSALSLARVP